MTTITITTVTTLPAAPTPGDAHIATLRSILTSHMIDPTTVQRTTNSIIITAPDRETADKIVSELKLYIADQNLPIADITIT